MSNTRQGVRNQLLLKLPDQDFDYLGPRLERIVYKLHDKLIRPNVPIAYVHFPDSGQISVIAGGHDSEAIEVGIIGREGITDMVLNAGADRTPLCWRTIHLNGAPRRAAPLRPIEFFNKLADAELTR